MAEQAASRCFLAEVFAPGVEGSQFSEECERLADAAEALALEGVDVVYVDSLLAPREETAFHLFEASDIGAAEKVLRRARIDADRTSCVVAPERRGAALRADNTRSTGSRRVRTAPVVVPAKGDEGDA